MYTVSNVAFSFKFKTVSYIHNMDIIGHHIAWPPTLS